MQAVEISTEDQCVFSTDLELHCAAKNTQASFGSKVVSFSTFKYKTVGDVT